MSLIDLKRRRDMKNLLNTEKFDLADVLKRGLSVRDEIIREFNSAREKLAKVDWQNELETFKSNPLDVAQSYLNQVNEALRTTSEKPEAQKGETETVAKPKTKTVKRASRTGASTPKSPRASKTTAKKSAPKKPVTKKAVAKKTVTKKARTSTAASKKAGATATTSTRKSTTATRSRAAAKK